VSTAALVNNIQMVRRSEQLGSRQPVVSCRVERRRRSKQNVTDRKNISAFLDLIASKLFEAAGPFALDELDEARHEAMCAARLYLRGKFKAPEAIRHVKDAVAAIRFGTGGRCAHEPVTEHHL
jgi:hypothetical protein